jgi:hypothetical protein
VGARRADAEEDLSLFFPLGAALAIAPCANCARVLVMCRRAFFVVFCCWVFDFFCTLHQCTSRT